MLSAKTRIIGSKQAIFGEFVAIPLPSILIPTSLAKSTANFATNSNCGAETDLTFAPWQPFQHEEMLETREERRFSV